MQTISYETAKRLKEVAENKGYKLPDNIKELSHHEVISLLPKYIERKRPFYKNMSDVFILFYEYRAEGINNDYIEISYDDCDGIMTFIAFESLNEKSVIDTVFDMYIWLVDNDYIKNE